MILIKEVIVKEIQRIVKELTGLDVEVSLEHPKDEKHGDYSTNVAMTIFSNQESRIPPKARLAKSGKNQEWKNPLELAKKISDQFMIHNSKFMIPARAEVVRPGFINFWLSKDYLVSRMIDLIKSKDEFGKSKKLNGKKIMLEFADPNPFKEFHIGHLRNITLGESYARLLESQRAIVWRVNYQGDVGMHVAKALYGISNQQLAISNQDKMSLRERVKLLGKAYAMGAKAYEEDDQAKKEIQSINIKIYQQAELTRNPAQRGQNVPDIRQLWEEGRRWSLDYFETIYKRVGTVYKRYYFESEVAESGRKLVLDHIKDGFFEKSEGAVVFKAQGSGLHTRVFITKEDYATYEAKDMALAPIKYKDFVYDKSIIITAHEQAPYFRVVLAAMKLVSPDLAAKTEHDSFGFVFLKDAKMSSRLGNIVAGEWLLDEAKARIKKAFPEMDEVTAEEVAVGAVKYSMLKVGRESNIAFDFNESISLEGNSGPYLQYTFARTQSVVRKSEIRNPKSETNSNVRNPNVQSVSNFGHLKFDIVSNFDIRALNLQFETEEISLLRAIQRFPEVVGDAAESFSPNLLCNYLFDLAQKFNLFYQKHKILQSRIQSQRDFRLALTQAVGQVLKNGLNLLGIQSPERM